MDGSIAAYLAAIESLQGFVENDAIDECTSEVQLRLQGVLSDLANSQAALEKINKDLSFLKNILQLKTNLTESVTYQVQALIRKRDIMLSELKSLKDKPSEVLQSSTPNDISLILIKLEEYEHLYEEIQQSLESPKCKICISYPYLYQSLFIMTSIQFSLIMANITLHYFDLYARGEVIRQILAYNGTEFRDHRVTFDDWPALRDSGIAEFGQLPILEIDGLKLVESRSISRYLCQKFGYYPSDLAEVYWVESICDLKDDIFTAVSRAVWTKDAEAVNKVFDEEIPWWLQKIEARLVRNNGGDGWFVGNNVSRADFEIFEMIYDGMIRPGLKERFGNLLSATPKLEAFLTRFVESSSRLKEYLESRPKCDF